METRDGWYIMKPKHFKACAALNINNANKKSTQLIDLTSIISPMTRRTYSYIFFIFFKYISDNLGYYLKTNWH